MSEVSIEQAAGRVIDAAIELRDENSRLRGVIEAVRDYCLSRIEDASNTKRDGYCVVMRVLDGVIDIVGRSDD